MLKRSKSLAVFMAMLFLFASTVMLTAPVPVAAQGNPGSGSLTTAILQVIPGIGTFTGTLTTTSFTLVNGVINAVGTITGTLTSTTGAVLGSVTNVPVTLPITGISSTCSILSLHTGPITLSILGLNVALSPIDLVVTATAGPGNLLGNLLCAVAHLLDTNAGLNAVVAHLNDILRAL